MIDQPRLATESDLQAVHGIIQVAYSKYLPRMDRPPAPMLQDMLRPIQAGQVWVIGRPITAVICLIPDDHALLIENIAVHPDAQARGLGRRLMDFAEDCARQLGLDRLQLYTNEVMSENLALYTHLGYRETGRYTDEGYRRVFMERVLQPN